MNFKINFFFAFSGIYPHHTLRRYLHYNQNISLTMYSKNQNQNQNQNQIAMKTMTQNYLNKLSQIFFPSLNNSENVQFLISKFFQDKCNLTGPSNLRSLVRNLYAINVNYFTIIPILFVQFFIRQLKENNSKLIDIEDYLAKKIQCFGDRFVRRQIQDLKEQENLKLDLTKHRKIIKKNFNLFKQKGHFQNINQLIDQIDKVSNEANKNLDQFQSFTRKICEQNDGTNFKVNVKMSNDITENKRFRNYCRAIEKIFQKYYSNDKSHKQKFIQDLDKQIKQNQTKSIPQIARIILNKWLNEIQKLLKERKIEKNPIQCTISDLIRGCCFFKTKKAVIKCAQSFMKQCQLKGYQILDINERIGRGTHEILLKIKINNVVGQFQLIRYRELPEIDIQNRQYIHNLYQIRRSPFGVIFGTFIYLAKFDQFLLGQLNLDELTEQLEERTEQNHENIQNKEKQDEQSMKIQKQQKSINKSD